MWIQNQNKHENLTYAALWGVLFLAPLISLYIRTVSNSDMTFDWQEVWMVWRLFGIYLLLFLVHNFFFAPLLIYRQKRWLYLALVACMLGGFTIYQCSHRPEFRGERFEFPEPPPPRHVPPAIIGQHDIVAIVILILMLGMNLGIKLYVRTRGDQKKLLALEKENLEQQLEYLKYQINPHFFMNTLNNIHALVDIDSEKCKETIVELSKMMRFILYEGDKQGVPLSREFDFIRHYVTLMKLRYTDRVRITLDLPSEAPDRQIPPLMLITFIENAFKHGISYQHPSFIDIKVNVDGMLHFTCRNSKAEKPNQEKGGVGLANARQRLHLLYNDNYTLNIQDNPDTYQVQLDLPLMSVS